MTTLAGARRRWLTAAAALSFALLAWSAPAGQETPTVWDGVFSAPQAERGHADFIQHCAHCHGETLAGGEGPALGGTSFWDRWGQRTLGDLFTYVSTNMPYELGALPEPMYLDLVAFLLRENGMPAGEAELGFDTVRDVRIVPEDGSGDLPNSTLAYAVGCLAPGEGGEWVLTRGSRAERAEAVTGTPDRPLGEHTYALLFVITPLDAFVGHKMAATGLLVGDGGADGINVSDIQPIADSCG